MRRFPLSPWPTLAAALLCLAPAASAQSPTPPPGANVDMQWGVKIPMRDGVTLNATLYIRPATRRTRSRRSSPSRRTSATPITSARSPSRAAATSTRSWTCVAAATPGACSSRSPTTRQDGARRRRMAREAAVVQRQGRDVGRLVRGVRPVGRSQGASAAPFDDRAGRGGHPGIDFPFSFNIFAPYDMQWLSFTSGVTRNGSLFGASGFWAARPASTTTRMAASPATTASSATRRRIFQKWLQHPTRRRLLRRDGPDARAVREAPDPDPDDHRRTTTTTSPAPSRTTTATCSTATPKRSRSTT